MRVDVDQLLFFKSKSLVLKDKGVRGKGEGGEGELFQTDSVFRNLGKPLPPPHPIFEFA